jgi:hypothetical protein
MFLYVLLLNGYIARVSSTMKCVFLHLRDFMLFASLYKYIHTSFLHISVEKWPLCVERKSRHNIAIALTVLLFDLSPPRVLISSKRFNCSSTASYHHSYLFNDLRFMCMRVSWREPPNRCRSFSCHVGRLGSTNWPRFTDSNVCTYIWYPYILFTYVGG